jgi:hypothetical protein
MGEQMEGTINSSLLATFFTEEFLMTLPTLYCEVHAAIDFEAQASLFLVCEDILPDSLLVLLLDCPLIEFPLNFSDERAGSFEGASKGWNRGRS